MSIITRADYWKSQDRKFCDFCKCWIADNKPSVQFHENGKRHKENVAKKISDITKKSAKEHKESLKLDADMKKMEEAAMKAYMKDIASNPDYTAQQIIQQLKESGKDVSQLAVETTPEKPTPVKKKKEKKKEAKGNVKKIWYEALSPEGYTYYWNSETSESVWEPPDNFVSLDSQKKEAEAQKKQDEIKNTGKMDELKAWKAREDMKKFRKIEEPEKCQISGPILGPAPKVDPYGKWTTVEKKVSKPVDLQLPKQELVEIRVPTVSEPRIKIKEKKVDSLDDFENVSATFKKRRINSNRGNIRQRFEDDD